MDVFAWRKHAQVTGVWTSSNSDSMCCTWESQGHCSTMPSLRGHVLKSTCFKSSSQISPYSCAPTILCLLHGLLGVGKCPNRRKFRSQTSHNMDRWKSRGGKSQRGEEKQWEDERRERQRRKKMQVHAKVGKSRFTVFFQCFVAPEGRKVGSLKQRVRSHVVRWDMQNCKPLWREAHVRVKMYKNTSASEHF